ncbi:transposable element Tcb2 transposase [Trichonephila clavipes]|nr:transposable element Tcb2 transposase [Trichonephila clavipes]
MINGRPRLHVVVNGTMTGQRYIDEVLLPHVRLFRGAVVRSPDLNPIENVWDALGRQVAGRNYPPTNKNTLIRALTEEWDKLPQQLLDNVVQTIRGLLATDLFISNHGQVARTIPELVLLSPNYHTIPTGGRLNLDRFNVHRPLARRVFSGTRLAGHESITLTTRLPRSQKNSRKSQAMCSSLVVVLQVTSCKGVVCRLIHRNCGLFKNTIVVEL